MKRLTTRPSGIGLLAFAAGFAALAPSAAHAALPSAKSLLSPEGGAPVRRGASDLVDELGQWHVDRNGTRWTPPGAVPPASVSLRPARIYDRWGNDATFELAPPPAIRVAANLDLPSSAQMNAAADAVFAKLMANAQPVRILLADAGGESAADIEARVERTLRDSSARPDLAAGTPAPSRGRPEPAGAGDPAVAASNAGPKDLALAFEAESAEIDPDLRDTLRGLARHLASAGAPRAVAIGYASVRDDENPDQVQAYARARRLAESRALALRQDLLELGAPASSVAIDARVAREYGVHRAELVLRAPAPASKPAAAQPAAASPPAASAPPRAAPALKPPRRLAPIGT